MASAIESLPAELADIIFDQMHLVDISRLMQCNKGLRMSLESRLYNSIDARNRAMFWACTHNHINLIQKLITDYHASASTLEIPAKNQDEVESYYYRRLPSVSPIVKVLTLNLVARRCHVGAFELLLRLGACVNDHDSSVSPYQPWFLLRRLCRPPKRRLLVLLFDAVASSRISLTKRQLDQILVLLVASDAPVDLIISVLDLGANPNYNHPYVTHSMVCSLSAAILRNSNSLFTLLHERGANIHGTNHRVLPSIPFHFPVFAAAHVIPRFGLAMMKLCLDKGADINQIARVKASNFRNSYTTTPVDIFLSSIRDWSPGEDKHGATAPADGLRFLLDNGASLDRQSEELESYTQDGQRYTSRPSSIEILLRRPIPKKLANPNFITIIELLIENGVLQKQDNGVAVQMLVKAKPSARENEIKLLETMITRLGGSDPPEPGFFWNVLSRAFPVLTVHDPYYHKKHFS